MGPAIRHAISKLEKVQSKTKLLFLIIDGLPQDRGYSREGVEKEYAVHDTKMALTEAKNKDINAFCLTVDKNGHDYLKTMTQDMGYEVLDDVKDLPERLLDLYRSLRIVNPSPFMAFFDFGEWQLIGSSPEVMVQAKPSEKGISANLRPIAGTRPRGTTEEEDYNLSLIHI